MNVPTTLASAMPIWQAALLLAPALAAGAVALVAGPRAQSTTVWRAARWANVVSLGAALMSLLLVCWDGARLDAWFRTDVVGGVVLMLVAFVGWVIVRFSQSYLNGERDERHYVRWLMATLCSVAVVLVTNNALLLALAWMATSLALHRLLTFFRDRPAAVVAAHKKFIVGRMADVAMLAAVALLFQSFGTLRIDAINRLAGDAQGLPMTVQLATLLIAGAALLKCAQLPFHGWLIQVMEAPTPVSALLHAGVVNLGGFVLLRFASLVGAVPVAQTLLVIVGCATAVLAALVMTTRISIKVMLAWSTCAQMGFMLMECGLGVWEMALLHLLAHSLYKAHAFLGAGGVVRRTMVIQLTPAANAPRLHALAIGAALGLGATLAAGALLDQIMSVPVASPATLVLAAIMGFGLVPLLQAQSSRLGRGWLCALGLSAFGVALLYVGLHATFAAWVVPYSGPLHAPAAPLWIGVALAFGALFLVQSAVTVAPAGGLARRLYPWFYGGLFLDEKFNQIAFALWQPPAPAATHTVLPLVASRATFDNPATSFGVCQ
ncbi:MAG: NADH-quinone oxidoreductase subunit L [Pseudomonadota bacterium]|nr:NADH-quinone oxidoreductase subunit L [Pseudomonadota bacterium]